MSIIGLDPPFASMGSCIDRKMKVDSQWTTWEYIVHLYFLGAHNAQFSEQTIFNLEVAEEDDSDESVAGDEGEHPHDDEETLN